MESARWQTTAATDRRREELMRTERTSARSYRPQRPPQLARFVFLSRELLQIWRRPGVSSGTRAPTKTSATHDRFNALSTAFTDASSLLVSTPAPQRALPSACLI